MGKSELEGLLGPDVHKLLCVLDSPGQLVKNSSAWPGPWVLQARLLEPGDVND